MDSNNNFIPGNKNHIRFIIYKRSHGFSVHCVYEQDRRFLTNFNKQLEVYGSRYDKRARRVIRELKLVYSTWVSYIGLYGLHISLYNEFRDYLRNIGASDNSIEVIENQTVIGAKSNIELSDIAVPKDYQEPIIKYVLDEGFTKVIKLQGGRGKAVVLSTLLKIPNGWITMGEIKAGDDVIAKDGTTSKVIGVFPQGFEDVYKVTFWDGRFAECSLDHLWKVYYSCAYKDNYSEVITLKDILNAIKLGKEIYIDLISSEKNSYKDFTKDPWLYGKEYTSEKEFDKEYLNGSTRQREALLLGLLNCNYDRACLSNYYLVYNLENVKIIQYLVRSLGGTAETYPCDHGGYEIYIRVDFLRDGIRNNVPIFKLLQLKSVEYIGKKETQCISIDHPEQLYVIDDFIVTHNTFCSLYAIALNKIRTVIVLEATLIEVWLKDMGWIYNNGKEETIIIKGNKDLKSIIQLGLKNEIKHSIIIISVGTIRDYLTEYEETGKSTYGCLPSELYNVLNVGFRITDEAHSNLHFHFRHDIETSVSKSLYLSATLKSNDPTINKMFNIIFPPQYRCKELDWDKYALVTSVAYSLKEPRKAKYMGNMGYSHIEYEKYLIKNKTQLYNYLELIIYLVNSRFMQKNLPDQKLMIFAASVDMCDIIAKFLTKELKDNSIKISAYTGEHEDEVLHNNTIVVTTLKKSGKGKDLKRLTTVINTVSIMARELNEQAFLRLRRIDDFYPGIDPEFITLVCLDIRKQVDYHKHRLEIFRPLTKRINNFRSSFII